eukprot:18207-Heterococcus_DN1.PRE.5
MFASSCSLPTLQATAATGVTTAAAAAAPVNAKRSRDDSNNADAPSTKQQRLATTKHQQQQQQRKRVRVLCGDWQYKGAAQRSANSYCMNQHFEWQP